MRFFDFFLSSCEESEISEREQEDINQDLESILTSQLEKKSKKNVYDAEAIEQKIEDIKLTIKGHDPRDEIPWIETLLLNVGKVDLNDAEDDLVREKLFYEMALKAANMGLDRLNEEGIPYTRPEDYFAEMIKTDDHMSKVKSTLLREKRHIEEAQLRTKTRMHRKFSKKAQREVQQQRQKEKKEELDAIKKWRKGRKDNKTREFPEDLLQKNSELRKQLSQATTPDQKKNYKRMTNTQRKAIKYGQGGKKRGLKRNTHESSNDMSEWNTSRNKSNKFSSVPKTKKTQSKINRPGKRKRQQGWTNSGGKKVKRQKTK